ncbi:L,D-transpeptidase [Streptomyces daliensis]|uniref:L,D-transpeptidase family protein n=1 Tax=Streptomyces daliensis TaxID=299421 RepID=A0A8T4ISJ7_9ACTN|nr:L,D-transpeptidase family protein [Streptomyces daliensis]
MEWSECDGGASGAKGAEPARGRFRTPRKWLSAVLAASVCALSAACGVAAEGKPSARSIRVTPHDEATGVRAADPLEVSVREGRLERVRVLRKGDAQRRALPGRLSGDGRTWQPAEEAGKLALASEYTVDVVALDGNGRRTARHTTFRTQVPEHRFIGFFTPEHRQTVGTGMIPSIDFTRPVADRAAVERAITVRAEPSVEIAAHWFGRSRLDFRPRTYWRPGTRVTLDLRLRDVKAAPGVYGVQHKRVHFTVGRDQRSVVDAARHTMTVLRDGAVADRVPVTAGAPGNPTYNGRMVVSEKFDVTRMNGRTVGFGGEYDIEDVPHAMRLTDSGTFLHGNYWAPKSTFGSANVSHGCVGLRDTKGGSPGSPAGTFFRGSLVGDVIEVRGSDERTVAPDNGLGGWNMDWASWRAGSALR